MDPSPIYVIGFMATGKSTIGALVAQRTGRRFVDLDAEIERTAEKPVARIFRDEGEAAFRRLEAKALADAAGEKDIVIACGGGTPCFGENLARMRRTGVVVALRASLQDILARAVTGGASLETRPLLSVAEGQTRSGIDAAAEQLYAEREAVYRNADVMIDTSGRSVEDVAAEATTRSTMRLGDVAVHLGDRSYPIHLAPLARAGELAVEMLKRPTAVAVVTDENVAAAGHAAAVRVSVERAGLKAIEVVVPPGERSKSLDQVGRVTAACVAGGLDRKSALLAVGGGVVGDLTGFVAAILFRGVRYGQVPTSLLAMVDSAIGGKTGVDLDQGKNLVGAFWQPRFVLADPTTLATLPERERRGALGEVLKYGLLGDPDLFAVLEMRGEPLEPQARESIDATDLVLRCARQKARLVERDESETTGERALLNLGHTVGHAIEAASAYSLLHGECVALGLVAAAQVSAGLGLCDGALPGRVAAAVRRIGLDANLHSWLRDDVVSYIGVDKKRAGAKVRFVALEGVGKPRLVDLAPEEIAGILRRT